MGRITGLILIICCNASALSQPVDSTIVNKNNLPVSTSSIQLTGYSQIRFQSFRQSGQKDNFDIRRARIDLRGFVATNWEYRLQFDLAGSPKLLDGYALYKFCHFFVQGGQFKIPFSRNNLTSSAKLEFIDRAQVVEALVARKNDQIGNHNGRDLGVQAGGSLVKLNDGHLIDLAFGVFNGHGINMIDNNEAKDFIGRMLFKPVKNLEAGIAYYNGYSTSDLLQKSEVRKRTGCELSYIYKFASVSGEYIIGKDGNVERDGYYAQFTSFIWKTKMQFAGRYEVYDQNTTINNDEIVYITGGLNYFFNDYARAAVNYTSRNEASNSDNDHVAVQVQISF